MTDFEELAQLAGGCRIFYPSQPEQAVSYFMESHNYSHLIAMIITVNVWSYLQAEDLLLTGSLGDPIAKARQWTPKDFNTKALRN
tara:strand:+ start:2065 stop:2319 length:255 start_codon:yes stop_codon:yes gene_type:complete